MRASTSGKSATISRYKALISWLNRNTTDEIRVSWPPIDVDNRFERLVYIMRVLQENPENVVNFLADRLWVSTRVIEDELSSMQYLDATCENSFLDTSFVINGITRARGAVRFLSTVHPILLMENLTCVVVMLQSLLEKAAHPAYGEWAVITAGHVWRQLTPYAKGRVDETMRATYPKDDPVLARFDELIAMPLEGRFVTEDEVHREAVSQLLYCFKASLPCRIVLKSNDGEIKTITGIPVPRSFNERTIRLSTGDAEEVTISIDQIIRSAQLN